MPLNFDLLKKHPYATGGVVIVGGIVVFYLMSSGSSSGSTAQQSPASIDAAMAQAQAAAAIQTNAQNAQLQQAQIAAGVQNNQTAAAVTTNQTSTLAALVAALSGNTTGLQVAQVNANAATLQQANQETSQQNIYSIQEAGLQDQINQAYLLNANNNATSLAGLVDTLNAQGAIAQQSLGIAGTLAQQQQVNQQANVNAIIPLAGQQKNSALDAVNQTTLFQTILSGGNPAVAATGSGASVNAAASGNALTGTIVSGIASLGKSFGAAIGAGLFG
jgi:hypothetical protein